MRSSNSASALKYTFMKSSIKIDYLDRGKGRGMEPVIKVQIIKSDDPRDTLVSHLFQSLGSENFLQFYYSNHKPVATSEGLPDYEKTVLLYKPEVDEGKERIELIDDIVKWIEVGHDPKNIRNFLLYRFGVLTEQEFNQSVHSVGK